MEGEGVGLLAGISRKAAFVQTLSDNPASVNKQAASTNKKRKSSVLWIISFTKCKRHNLSEFYREILPRSREK